MTEPFDPHLMAELEAARLVVNRVLTETKVEPRLLAMVMEATVEVLRRGAARHPPRKTHEIWVDPRDFADLAADEFGRAALRFDVAASANVILAEAGGSMPPKELAEALRRTAAHIEAVTAALAASDNPPRYISALNAEQPTIEELRREFGRPKPDD